MFLWKWLLGVAFLSVVISHETAVEVQPPRIENSVQNVIENKLKNLQLADLAKQFPEHQERLDDILNKLNSATDNEKVAILNDYTDECLALLNNFLMLNSIDPVPMEDIKTGFDFKVGFVRFWAEIKLANGWLQGLASLVRHGDVTLKYEYPHLKVHCTSGFGKLLFNYDYLIKFMGLGPTGGMDGSVDGSKFTFDLTIDLTTLKAELKKFKLDTAGKINLKFNGNIWYDWFVNLCVKFTLIAVTPVVRLLVQGVASSILHLICDEYNNAICQVLDTCL